ncbi:MAG: aldo/keto reductase [Bryobacterales bacterium]|nr:aldo/keto reductase [Bryobacterales bacterium]
MSAKSWSRLGLGCVTFGREISREESFAVMDYALAHGITLFDTAEAYGGGASERIVGEWMASRGVRGEVVLVTKVRPGTPPARLAEALQGSLERLRCAAVDLYLYHSFDAAAPVDERVAAMDAVARGGLATGIGCSNYDGAQLGNALAAADRLGAQRFSAVQVNYNLAAREIDAPGGLLDAAAGGAVEVMTYSPLAAGFLTGKYATPDRAAIPAGTRFGVIPGHADIYFHERNFAMLGRLRAWAERTGMGMERLAMGWVLANPRVRTVLVGAREPRHLDNALAAVAGPLRAEWVEEMSRA